MFQLIPNSKDAHSFRNPHQLELVQLIINSKDVDFLGDPLFCFSALVGVQGCFFARALLDMMSSPRPGLLAVVAVLLDVHPRP